MEEDAGDREPLEDDADEVGSGSDAVGVGAGEGGAASAVSLAAGGGEGSGLRDAAEGGSDDADPEVDTVIATLWVDLFAHPTTHISRKNEIARRDLRDSIYKCLFVNSAVAYRGARHFGGYCATA